MGTIIGFFITIFLTGEVFMDLTGFDRVDTQWLTILVIIILNNYQWKKMKKMNMVFIGKLI